MATRCVSCGERIVERNGQWREVAEGIAPTVCTDALDHVHRPVVRTPNEWHVTRKVVDVPFLPGLPFGYPAQRWVVIQRCPAHGEHLAMIGPDETVVGWASCLDALAELLRSQA